MKSPLVEALRQASGKKSTAEESTTHDAGVDAGQARDAAPDPGVPQADDLELMDTVTVSTTDNDAPLPVDDDKIQPIDPGAVLPIDGGGILPIDGGGILPIDGHGILPIEGAEPAAGDLAAAANEEADAEFYETSSLQLRDAATVASRADAGASTPLPPLSTNRHSNMPRLGLYSPLICMALAAASMGGYFAYQTVGGWYHNSDLESLSSQIGAAAEQDAADTVETGAAENHFKLIVGPQDSLRPGTQGQAVPGITSETQRRSSRSPQKIAPVAGFEDEAFDDLNAAYDAFEHGDTVAAEAGYRRALRLAPRHPNALQGLAAILSRTGRHGEALQHYETLLSVEPGNSAAAVALLSGGGASPDAADESEIKYLIQRHPDSAHLRFALGTHFATEMRWADARHAFDQALRLDPGNADFLFNLAVSLEHLGQYDDARHYYESALSAANATSTLNNDVAVARIEQLELLAKSERLVQ